MMPQGCRQVHHAEVVDRAIFATRNSLKSHMGRNLKSPFSKPRAITQKLYTHSRLAAGENHPASKSQFRALALLGRRLPERMDGIFIPASEKPAHQQTMGPVPTPSHLIPTAPNI